jgi:glycine/D-amino acid oxidase-like deaminating enzyme
MATHGHLPSEVDIVVIGAGFAGVSVAAALTEAGVTQRLGSRTRTVARKPCLRAQRSDGKPIGTDPLFRKLAIQGVERLGAKTVAGCPVLRQSGGLYLIHGEAILATERCAELREQCLPAEHASSSTPPARRRGVLAADLLLSR